MSKPFTLAPGSSLLLDLVRGVSAQAVLVGHALYFFNIHGPEAPASDFFVHRFAVGLFFILSGFLIPYSTRRKLSGDQSFGFSRFFADRFVRIYPTLLVALVFVLLVDTAYIRWFPDAYTFYGSFSAKDFFGNLLMLQYFPGLGLVLGERIEAFGSATTLWSLSIEWWLYMAYGWAVLRVFKNDKPGLWNLLVWLPLLIVPLAGFFFGRPLGTTILWLYGVMAYWLLRAGLFAGLSRLQLALAGAAALLVIVLRFYLLGDEYEPVMMFFVTLLIMLGIRFFSTVTWPAWLARSDRRAVE